jgi:lantibiotic modifying enzyme
MKNSSSAVVGVVLLIALVASLTPRLADRPYVQVARLAARWIDSATLHTPEGLTWPADPRDAKTVSTTLYSGTPGVVLFYLALARSTGERAYLDQARGGADWLLASLGKEQSAGLYEGLSGIGFTLHEVFKATRERKYDDGARLVVKRLRDGAKRVGKGVQWSQTTDIISGNAGTGLFLLYAAREWKDESARDLAIAAGERLIEVGRPEQGGIKWAMDPKFPRLMPNFSHGTAGIAYFLATLYRRTGRRPFLESAVGGAKYLQSVAKTDGDSCLIFHNEPDNRDLYYLGWCHGPAGTGRLFYRLYEATGDRAWLEWAHRSARALLASGIPEHQTPGFWNNVGVCCGNAGVAEYVLGLYRATKHDEYLAFAKRVTANLLGRATRDEAGVRWIQAEHRVRPELLVAQTGYMQGAAGIGVWLLQLDAAEAGRDLGLHLPDTPF